MAARTRSTQDENGYNNLAWRLKREIKDRRQRVNCSSINQNDK